MSNVFEGFLSTPEVMGAFGDREFVAAIREGREPNSSVASVLPCYQVLHDLELQLKN